MNHFRFHHNRVGYLQWRRRTASRQATLLFLPLTPANLPSTGIVTWQGKLMALSQLDAFAKVLSIGGYLIGEDGDPLLWGHPDINYY